MPETQKPESDPRFFAVLYEIFRMSVREKTNVF